MSSLSSVVSNLVRASIGTSASQVTDEDLDKHVAELILKEAKKKAERFGQDGIRAYLRSGTSDSNAPRTNKRFLTSIIRSTDDHNKTILQAQALAAQELKRERDEADRRERRARAEEAVEAEKLRRSRGEGSSRRRANENEGWDRWDGRTAERPKRKLRAWDTYDGEDSEDDDEREHEHERDSRSGRHRSRSRHRHRRDEDRYSTSKHSRRDWTPESRDSEPRRRRHDEKRSSRSHRKSRRRSSSRPDDDRRGSMDSRNPPTRASSRDRRRRHSSPSPARSYTSETDSRPRKRRRSGSPSDSHSASRHSRHSSPPPADNVAVREVELRQKLKSTRSKTAVRPTEISSKSKRARTLSRSRTKSPEPAPKRTKAEPSSSRPVKTRAPSRSPTPGPEPEIQLPSKMDKYFEASYDPRLDVAPLNVPRVPATGLINNAEFAGWDAMLQLIQIRKDDREEKKMMERLGLVKDKTTKAYKPISSAAVSERWGGEGSNIMEIEYNKRGSVREWDMGKEGF